ncbi:hypothetical protein [Paeniglutamicibacter psychrophenolicus]|uniref:hypothetical protein n=1 Tax=Paeniglutamicibacter psychrophenolicus TaxID=257454 RepID=UPI00278A2A8E|nr:hypothetical protein [Paeniglutamicibacter psychrophenolicus]MDQ0094405.1 hypothetical protein [Paeniglutamicibacter psychrophenolicus]
MARRKVKPLVSILDGSEIPVWVLEFALEDWQGDCGYHQWKAWNTARTAWATENLPDGVASLPWWEGRIPDRPWSEVAHTI